jgi:3-oxoacyl-[acyl-carrier protein] reductase
LDKLLQDKMVLVTGASRGIGQGIAMTLAKAGATVIGTATTQEGATQISENLKSAHLKGEGMVLNVRDPGSIETLFQQMASHYSPIQILVNNAAITQDNLMMRMKDEEWHAVIDTNLNAVYQLSKRCIREMLKARFGRIISIGSVVGSMGNPGQTNYAAAKAGLIGFSKALALEVGSRSITVNVVSPGFIETDMTQVLTEDQRKMMIERIPMQKIGTIHDVAQAVLFLASPMADYITGQTLHVNGGLYVS